MARSAPPARATPLVAAIVVGLRAALTSAAAQTAAPAMPPAAQCEAAVRAAERHYALPAGLLGAISLAETGRPDPATGAFAPWPWSVQAEGRGLFFDTKEQAVHWVRDAQARGVASIDAGCLQVNLAFHPNAFATLDEAFDPRRNADYAARFLLRLQAASGDWRRATGAYHSQTQVLAGPYVARVQSILGPRPIAALQPAASRPIDTLADAWRATIPNTAPVPVAPSPSNETLPSVTRAWETLLRSPPARFAATRRSAQVAAPAVSLATQMWVAAAVPPR